LVRQHHTVTRPFLTRTGSSIDSTDLLSTEDARGSPTAGHLALFNQNLSRTNREVEWIYFDGSSEADMVLLLKAFPNLEVGSERGSKTTPLWFVEVRVDGSPCGLGRGNTKKSARNEAAKAGLSQLGIPFWSVSQLPISMASPDLG
ncbi:hypothetical protein HDZ31DRAFT_69913, partial [Schizophyllum fasciatum]